MMVPAQQPGRFLIAVWPFPSHLFPLIAIARALRAAGHSVAFYTGGSVRALLQSEGFACLAFDALDEGRIERLMAERGDAATRTHPRRMRALLRRWLVDTLPAQVEDLARLLGEWRPDVLLTETSLWAPALVLRETHRLPVAVFSTVIGCMLPGPDAPPFGPGLPPPRTPMTRLLAWAARRAGDLLAADVRAAANQVRARYDLPPVRCSVTALLGQMPLYLMPSAPELDYRRGDLPTSVHYIGPVIWNRPPGYPPAWLDDLPRDQPWVHVTEGTVHAQQPRLLRAGARGLAGRPVQVILTTGSNRDPERLDLGPRALNVHVASWISHSDLLPRTDVLVTTGGAGTVMAALAAGVPMVVVPTEWDKYETAQRVVAAGAGMRLDARRCSPERLRAAVEHVLRTPAFRERAQELRRMLERYPGPGRAVELLETLLAERPPGGRARAAAGGAPAFLGRSGG